MIFGRKCPECGSKMKKATAGPSEVAEWMRHHHSEQAASDARDTIVEAEVLMCTGWPCGWYEPIRIKGKNGKWVKV